MQAKIALVPGDGIGPEVVQAAVRVLDTVAAKYGHSFTYEEALLGIVAINATGSPLPPETLKTAEQCDAILMGAVGGPAGSTPPGAPRPEEGILGLRKHFGLFANLRPVKVWPALVQYTPFKPELLDGVDILFIRELTGGLYFGARQEWQGDLSPDATETIYDTMVYAPYEVARAAKIAFDAARLRRNKVCSVDKANILATSRMWRRTVEIIAEDYPEVSLSHQLVDSFAMLLMTRPAEWDVVVTENMFGDILTDQASVLAGSLGMLPSASLNEGSYGLYEPIHGSAPDIAGKGIANPTGTIMSAALLLRYTLKLENEAQTIEKAVAATLDTGARTADIAGGGSYISTTEFADTVIQQLA
jgi:3-isopropylmalate dehydrogenase